MFAFPLTNRDFAKNRKIGPGGSTVHRHIRQPDEECQPADRDEQALVAFRRMLTATRAFAHFEARRPGRTLRALGWVCCPTKAYRPDLGVESAIEAGPTLRLRGGPA